MATIGKLGQDEGKHTGPPPGDGANVAHTADTDGTPGDMLPERRDGGSPRKTDPSPRPTQQTVVPDQVSE